VALTQREKYIAIGTASVLGAVLIYEAVVSPIMAQFDAIDARRADLQKKIDDASDVFSRQRNLEKIWKELQAGGLNADASQAESQTLNAIIAWAEKAGVQLSALKPERTAEQQKFQVISFNVTGSGQMPDVARLLWAMETAPIPLRVNDLDIHPLKEGTDDLTARVSVSALCLPPQNAGGSTGSGMGGTAR